MRTPLILGAAMLLPFCASAAQGGFKDDILRKLERIQHECSNAECRLRVCEQQEAIKSLTEEQLQKARHDKTTGDLLANTVLMNYETIARICSAERT